MEDVLLKSRNIKELCHRKTCPKIFVVVIPKEGLTDMALPTLSVGMTLTIKLYTVFFKDSIL